MDKALFDDLAQSLKESTDISKITGRQPGTSHKSNH
jgi:hypothetical protein